MGNRDLILESILERGQMTGPELAELLGVSRQAVNKHLRALILDGKVAKHGVTRGAVYRPAGRDEPTERRRRGTYPLKGLEEDRVFLESSRSLGLRSVLSENAWEILSYAFTEMLNNAIEHSRSEKCDVIVTVDQYAASFVVRDFGIGIYHSIKAKFGLIDENEAVGQLVKGKTTTMKERHSGEGVFFTSKCADRMTIRSHSIELVFDNPEKDIVIHEKRFLKGTEVRFEIRRRSRRKLNRVFTEFAPEEFGYQFEATWVLVKLFQKEYVSRSEARRLMTGLHRFKKIRLDFRGVKSIGQAFADEVFRVFPSKHPDIEIETENLSRALRTMILHVVDNKSRIRLTFG